MLCNILRLAVLVVVASVCGTSAAKARRDSCPNDVDARCCALLPVIKSLQNDPNLFNGRQCNPTVRKAVRLAFHDAIGFSKTNPSSGGGADGSIITFKNIELQNGANTNLNGIIQALENLLSRSRSGGIDISAGDIIQLAAAVGIGNCPGAPQLQFLLGRPNATMAADPSMIVVPTASADDALSRFNDAGFSPFELVALLASHSIATSTFVQPGARFDCTPHKFDTQFYNDVLQNRMQCPFSGNSEVSGAPEIRIASDTNISRDNRTTSTWQSFANDQTGMVNAFKGAMAKLAVVGQDTSKMIDCSAMIPKPRSS